MAQTARPLELRDYRSLAQFRFGLRSFLAFSERALRREGLPPRQYQALLALKGLPEGATPTIGTLADRLLIRHHSAVALAGRLEMRGFVTRRRAEADHREVHLALTPAGERVLARLAGMHRAELAAVGPDLKAALGHLLRDLAGHPGSPS